jgi:hypothetical protein
MKMANKMLSERCENGSGHYHAYAAPFEMISNGYQSLYLSSDGD